MRSARIAARRAVGLSLAAFMVASIAFGGAPASAHGGHSGPPDDSGFYAYCNLNTTKEAIPSTNPHYWVSCQYGPTTAKLVKLVWTMIGNGTTYTPQPTWSDTSCDPFVCTTNGGGLFQMSYSANESPDEPWTSLSVTSCAIFVPGRQIGSPCQMTVISSGSDGYPPYPSHWWPGGADGNAWMLGTCSTAHAACVTGSRAEPVNTANGGYYTSVTDASYPGIGVPFAFSRSYNSADPATGPLGPGWTHSYNSSLSVKGNGDVVLRAEDGQQLTFFVQQDGSYAPGAWPGTACPSLATARTSSSPTTRSRTGSTARGSSPPRGTGTTRA